MRAQGRAMGMAFDAVCKGDSVERNDRSGSYVTCDAASSPGGRHVGGPPSAPILPVPCCMAAGVWMACGYTGRLLTLYEWT